MRKIIVFLILLFLSLQNVCGDDFSHTLPVIYIHTVDNQPITSKYDYIEGTYYLDPMGIEGIEAVGSKDEPLALEIKGRGNYTWGYFDKKPYKLKLGKKQALMGMSKSKHFALLAHADDNVAFLRNTVGFEISRRIGLPYTPKQCPIEVVLNGDYIGLYFLTETIRIETERVNIVEQADEETNPDKITGGWLVEIDNNNETEQIKFSVEGTDLEWLWITYHSPELLSNEQTEYLTNQFENIIQAIYTEDKQSTEWEQLIDINTLAKLYIVHEVIDHLEGFLGSCYLYKDYGETKWKFGPVWDLGNAFNDYHSKDKFIYQDSPFPTSIIKEIALFPRFQQEVRKVWNDFYPYQLESIDDFINSFLNQIALAAECDALRWPNYGNANVYASSEVVFDRLHSKIDWLNIQWNTSSNIIKNNEIRDTNQYLLYDFSGRQIADKKKMYIMRQQLPDGTVQTKKYLK